MKYVTCSRLTLCIASNYVSLDALISVPFKSVSEYMYFYVLYACLSSFFFFLSEESWPSTVDRNSIQETSNKDMENLNSIHAQNTR